MNQEFGQYIKQLRTNKSLSIRELAKLTGISNAYLSQLENGKRGMPSPDILKKMYKPLGVTYEEMMKKAGYIVRFTGEERIKELENKLKAANERIKELEKGYISISDMIRSTLRG